MRSELTVEIDQLRDTLADSRRQLAGLGTQICNLRLNVAKLLRKVQHEYPFGSHELLNITENWPSFW